MRAWPGRGPASRTTVAARPANRARSCAANRSGSRPRTTPRAPPPAAARRPRRARTPRTAPVRARWPHRRAAPRRTPPARPASARPSLVLSNARGRDHVAMHEHALLVAVHVVPDAEELDLAAHSAAIGVG